MMAVMQEWIEKNLAARAAIQPEAPGLTTEEVISVLRGAHTTIKERGWTQRTGCGPNDEVCSATSISSAMISDDDLPQFRYARYAFIAHAVAIHLGVASGHESPEPQDALIDWNDEPGRTKEEVLEAFEGAIEDLATGRIRIEDGRVVE